MIKFEHTKVMNFDGAIRGMRNPLNSWEKSDSEYCNIEGSYMCNDCPRNNVAFIEPVCVGNLDLALMKALVKGGPDHRKFMRQIIVSVDITAPLYWWKEFDTYKVGTVANSCSTMHKIHDKEFTLEDFSYEHLSNDLNAGLGVLYKIIEALNLNRELYLNGKDKSFWWNMIQLLPTSYNQCRTITLNYEVLYNIYGSRRNHKLDEWSVGFMDWIKSLPYAEELILCLTN